MLNKYFIFTLGLIACGVVSAIDTKPPENRGGVTILTVGTDSNCDYDSIQDAIDEAPLGGQVEIRITTQQQWFERINITNKSNLSLIGRYNSCNQLGAIHSVIKGSVQSSAPPAIIISNSQQISLYGLEVRDAAFSGGIEISNSQVNINYTSIENNQHRTVINGLTGGGLYVTNNSTVTVSNSFIYANQAARGGGIGCLGSQLTINNTQIGSNNALSNNDNGVGGGIYASGGCQLALNNFDTTITYNNNNTINNNAADYQGGGLFVTGGAQVSINDPNDSNFLNNSAKTTAFLNNRITASATLADSGGAGIAADGVGSNITAYHLTLGNNAIDSNTADGGGGALLLQDQATFSMNVWKADNNCVIDSIPDLRTNRMCNQIYNHALTSGNKGGVAYLKGLAEADIFRTFITENRASDAHLAYLKNGTLRMQGNIITQNGNTFFGGGELVYAESGGDFIVDFTTFTNNRLGSGLGDGYIITTAQAGLIHFSRSIIDEAAETIVFGNSIDTTSFFECLLSHEHDSFIGTNITVGIPHYQSTWPYHLHQASDGIDMCGSTGSLTNDVDIDGDLRGVCHDVICPINRFDVGADEYRITDLIYQNGFD